MEKAVNERIKVLRTHLGITQNDFAMKIDSTLATISRTENGMTAPQPKMINKIIEVFGVNRDWILHGTGEMLNTSVMRELPPVNWKDEAYKAIESHIDTLKQENAWLRNLLSKQMGVPANFNLGNALALGGNPSITVRGAA